MGKKKNYKQNNLRTVKLPSKEKKKNIAAWILVILMIIWSIGSVFGTLAYFRGSGVSTLSAAADIDDTTDLTPSIEDFDITDYPSANYFDVSQVPYDSTATRGVKAISNGLVNSIVIANTGGGQAMVLSSKRLYQLCPYIRIGETYTLTFESTYPEKAFFVGGVLWRSGESRVITDGLYNGTVGFYCSPSDTTISKIMFNKGSTAYPYFPYFYSFYQYGKDLGYNEGITSSGYGIFGSLSLLKFDVYTTGIDDTNGIVSLNALDYPNLIAYITNGIDIVSTFNSVANSYLRSQGISGEDYDYFINCPVKLYVDFINPIPFDTFKISVNTGSSRFINGGIVVNYNDNPLIVPWVAVDNTTDIYYIELSGDGNVVSFATKEYFYATQSFTINLTEYLPNYYLGYQNGFNAGEDSGLSQGYNNGFNAGKESGYNEGYSAGEIVGEQSAQTNAYNNGYQKGKVDGINSANANSFDNLLSAVFDVPVRTITSVLDFDLLGINLKTFFFSLLTVCVIIAVVKLFI